MGISKDSTQIGQQPDAETRLYLLGVCNKRNGRFPRERWPVTSNEVRDGDQWLPDVSVPIGDLSR